jgi:hypothetical protein
VVHLPPHPSRLNQIEIYFSIVRRTALMPNDFADLAAMVARLPAFEALYNDTARPFDRRFTRATPEERLAHLAPPPAPLPAATSRSEVA